MSEQWAFGEIFGEGSQAAARWGALADGWLSELRSPAIKHQYRRVLNMYLAWLEKDPGLATDADGQAFAQWLEDDLYMPNTIYGYMIAVSSFYTAAAAQRPQSKLENPARRCVKLHKKLCTSLQPLTKAEMERLLAAVDREGLLGLRDYALLGFLIDTVWPAGAALHVRWGDFQASMQGMTCRRPAPADSRSKDARGASQQARLRWQTWGAIVDYLEAAGRLEGCQAGDYIFTRLIDLTGDKQQMFGAGWDREPFSSVHMCNVLEHAGKRAGLPRDQLTLTNLRHSAAVLRRQEGASVEEIQRLLDHKTRKITARFLKHSAGTIDIQERQP